MAGIVGFGISYYGTLRANKYKQYSPILAHRVYSCYQIPPEAAQSVGEPLADTFMMWFPQYVETASKVIDPGVAVARLLAILQQTSDNEKRQVESFMSQARPSQSTPPTNGTHSDIPEEPVAEWMENQAPTPKEI